MTYLRAAQNLSFGMASVVTSCVLASTLTLRGSYGSAGISRGISAMLAGLLPAPPFSLVRSTLLHSSPAGFFSWPKSGKGGTALESMPAIHSCPDQSSAWLGRHCKQVSPCSLDHLLPLVHANNAPDFGPTAVHARVLIHAEMGAPQH